jgi:hypothetical protein
VQDGTNREICPLGGGDIRKLYFCPQFCSDFLTAKFSGKYTGSTVSLANPLDLRQNLHL